MSVTALQLLAVTLGGAVGGVARYWVSGLVARSFGERFPWGTLVVNVTGATLIGLAAGLALSGDVTAIGQPSAWALLVVGILGSYTTVSSFSFQTLALLRAGEAGQAAANAAASVSLCLGAAAVAYLSVAWMVRT